MGVRLPEIQCLSVVARVRFAEEFADDPASCLVRRDNPPVFRVAVAVEETACGQPLRIWRVRSMGLGRIRTKLRSWIEETPC